ncbi:hypothetical protein O5O45_21290 [Hahella aquimaris]|uniref:PA4575 family protein n=1 Tax=Hahella sp. HNIBRBA332 TaxID=3015983 RepID=UPI00273A8E8E|nr:hypothetical protein [Hahella sp. HNIBRBA332]WLQ12263.1 hypothetical protein O5O45_21290 [Hahella sp. HNIBRBA332]
MRLDYRSPLADDAKFCALSGNDRQRVELFIKDTGDATYTLIALAGQESKPAVKVKLQGPYHSFMQARAAMNAIAGSLLNINFDLLENAISIWGLQAQAQVRKLRQERKQNMGDYRFNPDDVYF